MNIQFKLIKCHSGYEDAREELETIGESVNIGDHEQAMIIYKQNGGDNEHDCTTDAQRICWGLKYIAEMRVDCSKDLNLMKAYYEAYQFHYFDADAATE